MVGYYSENHYRDGEFLIKCGRVDGLDNGLCKNEVLVFLLKLSFLPKSLLTFKGFFILTCEVGRQDINPFVIEDLFANTFFFFFLNMLFYVYFCFDIQRH